MSTSHEPEKIIGTLTCPHCGHKQAEEIPLDACTPFYKCQGCGKVISSQKSCCVFCDYGDRPCPVGALGHGDGA